MEKEYLEQLIEKADRRRKKKKTIFDFFSLRRVKAAIIIVVVLGTFIILQLTGFDMDLDCTKADNICTISKKSILDAEPFKIARFDTGSVIDVFVRSRKLEDGSVIYDLLLDYGETRGKYFVDYGYNTVIKANTAKMKLTNYLNGSARSLNINKHCYFNDYFCF